MLFRWNCASVSLPSEDSASAPSSTKKGLSLHPLVSSTLGQATPVPLRHEVSHSLRKGNILSSPLRESQGPRELLFNGPGVPFIAIGIIDGNAY